MRILYYNNYEYTERRIWRTFLKIDKKSEIKKSMFINFNWQGFYEQNCEGKEFTITRLNEVIVNINPAIRKGDRHL